MLSDDDIQRVAIQCGMKIGQHWNKGRMNTSKMRAFARAIEREDRQQALEDAALAAAPQPPSTQADVCRSDGRCQYAIDHGAEREGHCPTGKCVMPSAQYPLPDDLYPGSKDWVAADYRGRVEWLHTMYESKKRDADLAWSQVGNQIDAVEALRDVVYAYQMHPVHLEQAIGRARAVLAAQGDDR